MATEYTVQEGDSMGLIANRFGFRDWQPIYRHPDNATFRRTCPDPNLLVPGTRLVIPDRPENAVQARATGEEHTFVVRRSTDVLRLRLHAPDGTPRAGWKYRLKLGDEERSGIVPDSGDVVVPLRKPVQSGRLAAWPADGPEPKEEDEIELRIGALRPEGDPQGVQARLCNLGLLHEEPDGDLEGEASVRALRRLDDPSWAGIARKHGC